MVPLKSFAAWSLHIRLNYMAVVDALLPATLVPNYTLCTSYFIYGGHELSVWEYLLISLDNLPIPLTIPTSDLLDLSALYLYKKKTGHPLVISNTPIYKGLFSTLPREERSHALTLLETQQVPLDLLPVPYKDNANLLLTMIDTLFQLTFFGYFSEWYGYRDTRLMSPSFRKLTQYPISWVYTGYPGPSYGYRDFRGFLLIIDRDRSE